MFKNIFKFAWRNTWRNKRRTFFTLLAVAVGVMAIIFARSYITGALNNSVDMMIKTEVGHIMIAHKEYLRLERTLPREYMVGGAQRLQTELASLPEVESIRSQIKFNVLLSYGDANEIAAAVGIEPEKMDKSMKLSETVIQGHYLKGDGLDLLIGKKLADKLKVKPGDELLIITSDINYSTYALPFKIAGIFETGFSYFDNHILYIPLEKAQEMLDCNDSVHEMLLFLKNPKQSLELVEKVKNIIKAVEKGERQDAIQPIPWQQNDLVKSIPLLEGIWARILGIIMFIVALVILNTMLMAVMERYHEIGVIKALGFKDREIFFMILVEAFYLGTIGSAIGGILGGTLSARLEKTGIEIAKMGGGVLAKIDIPAPFIGKVLYPDFTFGILIGSIVFGIIIALLAVLFPAFKSARMSPVEAFRSELKV